MGENNETLDVATSPTPHVEGNVSIPTVAETANVAKEKADVAVEDTNSLARQLSEMEGRINTKLDGLHDRVNEHGQHLSALMSRVPERGETAIEDNPAAENSEDAVNLVVDDTKQNEEKTEKAVTPTRKRKGLRRGYR